MTRSMKINKLNPIHVLCITVVLLLFFTLFVCLGMTRLSDPIADNIFVRDCDPSVETGWFICVWAESRRWKYPAYYFIQLSLEAEKHLSDWYIQLFWQRSYKLFGISHRCPLLSVIYYFNRCFEFFITKTADMLEHSRSSRWKPPRLVQLKHLRWWLTSMARFR